MLSLIYDNSEISNNMIIIMSCFLPFWDKNTHMNVSITVFIIFALSSIDKYYLQIFFFFSLLFYFYYRFSYTQIWYYLISDTVLNWHFNDLKQNSCPRLFTYCCRCCSSFHFPFCSKQWLWIHFHIINQRYWCPFT